MSTDPSQPSSYEADDSRAALQSLLAENARALDAASARHIEDGYARLHELLLTKFEEKDRALEMAADEREKAASVLREEQHRALTVAEAEREKAASALRAASDRAIHDNYERLHELLITLFQEKDRALTMASEEREKAAQVLRDEQHRALTQADKEREKAAVALRDSLDRSREEGDDRLREHIANQVQQIIATLKSGELLEIQRIRGVRDELSERIAANTREFQQIQSASQEAVKKAEEAQGRVNEGSDEFRQQLAAAATMLMPRRESEAKHEAHVQAIRELRDDLGKLRTDLAVGPAGLAPLQTSAAKQAGRLESSQAVTAALISVTALFIAATSVIVAIVTH